MFTTEQEEAIKKLITDTKAEETVKADLLFSEQFEKLRRDLAKTTEGLKTAISSDFEKMVDARFESIAPSIKFIEEVKVELEKKSPQVIEKQEVANNDSVLLEMQNRLKTAEEALAKERDSMKARMESFEKQANEAEERRNIAEQQTKLANQREQILGTIRANGSVRPGTEKQLLLLLESDGILEEHEGKLKVKAKDKFGDDIYKDFSEVLPTMLDSQFAHFVTSRPGSGTSLAPQTSAKQQSFNLEDMSTQELYDKAQNGGDEWKSLLSQIAEQYR